MSSVPHGEPVSQEQSGAVNIEAARLSDLPSLARVQKRAFSPRLAYTLPTLLLLRALPWVRILVARRGDEVVGCIIGDRVIEGGRVINLAVAPAARRLGIGTALLRAIEEALPEGDMILMVQSENRAARALYLGLGYVDDAELGNYYGPGRPGIRMRKGRG